MTFDPERPYATRDGRKVRILCTDAAGDQPIVGYIETKMGEVAQVTSWSSDGHWCPIPEEDRRDLINTPDRVSRWMGVAKDGHSPVWSTKEEMPVHDAFWSGEQWESYVELIFENDKLVETRIHEA